MKNFTAFLDSMKYTRFVVFHPFKGFWDLKHAKIGKIESATVLTLLFSLVTILRCQFTGFLFNTIDVMETNLLLVFLGSVLPILIWVLANWAITTLVDGEGTAKDIYIATAYSLVPYIVMSFVLVLLSNFMILDEASIYYLLDGIGIVWSVLLLLVGMMTIHQFFVGKTLLTVFLALVGMVVILFVVLLFFSLVQQMINFFIVVWYEVAQ